MSPSECYAPFMDVMMAKIQLSKLVIEFLNNTPEATYEDLLNHLQTAPPLNGQVVSFSEDALLRHSQFIVDQVSESNSKPGSLRPYSDITFKSFPGHPLIAWGSLTGCWSWSPNEYKNASHLKRVTRPISEYDLSVLLKKQLRFSYF